MGEALAAFYSRAEQVGGIKAKVRLAELTQMPSTVAAVTRDTEELVARFHFAMREVIEELGGVEGQIQPSGVGPEHGWDACTRLLIDRDRYIGSREGTAREITEHAAQLVGISRASVWYLEDGGHALACVDAYDARRKEHEAGERISTDEAGPYLEAIRNERTVAASDARRDPRTSCLRARYLEPRGLAALLDTPIWSRGALLGVLCCEHEAVRRWSRGERELALFLGQLAALGEELRAGSYAEGR